MRSCRWKWRGREACQRRDYLARTRQRRPIRRSLFGGIPGASSAARRGWARSRSPGAQTARAAPPGAKASAMKARRGETPKTARCAARQRGPASPGDAQIRDSADPLLRLHAKSEARKHANASMRRTTEPQIRQHDEARNRIHESPASRRSVFKKKRLRATARRRLCDSAATRIRADPHRRRLDHAAMPTSRREQTGREDHTAPRRGGAPRAT